MHMLKYLLQGVEVRSVVGDKTVQVTDIEFDSRKVKSGSLFFATRGTQVDGHTYIPAAIATVITLFILVSLERLEKRMFLNGVNKILAITCSTATPDLKAVRKILESKGVFIVSVSFETFYKEDRSVITYKVNVKAISSYTNLFNEIRSLGIVTQIRLMA